MVYKRRIKQDLNVGIIGCGAIGCSLAKAIDEGAIDGVKLSIIFDSSQQQMDNLLPQLKSRCLGAKTFSEFIETEDLDLVIEAASQEAAKQYSEEILESKKDLLILSVGALLDNEIYKKIIQTARRSGSQVFIASGAIAGVDAIKAAKRAGLEEVLLITRKNPKSFKNLNFKSKKMGIGRLSEPTILYEGSALEAVKIFPANVNVAATLSLVGLGAKKTKVRIIADPRISENIHEIFCKGISGEIHITVKNLPHPNNPGSSYLAALSTLEMIKRLSSKDVIIGT